MKKLILLIFYLFLFQVNVGWGQTIQPADYLYFETDIYESPYDLLQTKDGSFIRLWTKMLIVKIGFIDYLV